MQAQKGPAQRLAPRQVAPQSGVVVAAVVLLFTKDPVMLAAHVFGAVTHGTAKIFVGIDDDAVRGEFNHRHRTTDRRQLGVGLGQRTAEAFDFQQVSLVM
ncbi:hypothetical protein D3C76_1721610 [compost metagenome]